MSSSLSSPAAGTSRGRPLGDTASDSAGTRAGEATTGLLWRDASDTSSSGETRRRKPLRDERAVGLGGLDETGFQGAPLGVGGVGVHVGVHSAREAAVSLFDRGDVDPRG